MNGTGIEATNTPRLVAVTGAGGFIGRHMVRALREAGHRVRAVTRTAPHCAGSAGPADDAEPPVPGGNAERAVSHPGDDAEWPVAHPGVAANADWRSAVGGAYAIVHLAGLAHVAVADHATRQRLRQLNVLSTQRLAAAAAEAGVRDFIFMSSIKAVAGRSDSTPLTEDVFPAPQDCYGCAKLAAERRLARLQASAPAMRIVVLRPPLVYGPGVGANFAALLNLVRRGVPLPLADVRNRRSLLYVGNLTAAVARCLERTNVPSGTFHLSDGDAVSTADLVRAIARAQGRTARLFGVPVGLLGLAARLAGRQEQAARLLDSLEVSHRHFCCTFDWQPPFTLDEGLQATARGRRVNGPDADGGEWAGRGWR